MEKWINLYLEFLKKEYLVGKESIENTRKDILKNPSGEYGIAYIEDDYGRDLQVNINFKERVITYYIDDELVKKEDYSEEEFDHLLADLDYDTFMETFYEFDDMD